MEAGKKGYWKKGGKKEVIKVSSGKGSMRENGGKMRLFFEA